MITTYLIIIQIIEINFDAEFRAILLIFSSASIRIIILTDVVLNVAALKKSSRNTKFV